jgi:hypothetical protein
MSEPKCYLCGDGIMGDQFSTLQQRLAEVERERDEFKARVGHFDSGASMPLAAALKDATPGPVHVEPDDSFADNGTRYRIVVDEDARRYREDHKTTARPPYIATVYSAANAELYRCAHNVLPGLIEHHRIVIAHRALAIKERDEAICSGDMYRAMLCDLLASGHPHPTEHPTMARQWRRARRLLKFGSTLPENCTGCAKADRATDGGECFKHDISSALTPAAEGQKEK